MKISDIEVRLQAWCMTTFGAHARAVDVRSLGGHSGVTIGFDVTRPQVPALRLVLKMPPPGVPAKSNFDVLRQRPLLEVLGRHGVPAPAVSWHSDDATTFGGPYLMMARLPGASLPDLFTPDSGRGVLGADQIFDEAVAALVSIHSIDACRELADWSAPRLVPDEIEHWVGVLRKSRDRDWIAQGLDLRDRLQRVAPHDAKIGLVHGDYYSNNWLVADRHLTGIVDWEGTSIGPVLLDLGWLCMMYDRASWGPVRRATMDWHPGPDDFIASYRKRSALDLSDLPFYRALAAYRLAALTAYYYELHRSGKRHNPAWEVFADSFAPLVGRATELLETRPPQRTGANKTNQLNSGEPRTT